MLPKPRRTAQQLEEELQHHVATGWEDFRRFAPKEEVELHEAVLRFSEGPFVGKPISSVPAWYLDFLCTGGENFLLWKDVALADAISKMGYNKVVPPTIKTAAQLDRELMPPPPRPSSGTHNPDYSILAKMARDAPDKNYLLTAEETSEAAAEGPALHLQSEVDVCYPRPTFTRDMLTEYSEPGRTTPT